MTLAVVGCGWLGPADACFVTETGAPVGFSIQAFGYLNRLPSVEKSMMMRRMLIIIIRDCALNMMHTVNITVYGDVKMVD